MSTINTNPDMSSLTKYNLNIKLLNKINNPEKIHIKYKARFYMLFLYIIYFILIFSIVLVIYNHQSPDEFKMLNNKLCFIKYVKCDKFISFLIFVFIPCLLVIMVFFFNIDLFFPGKFLRLYKRINNIANFITYYFFKKDEIVILQIQILIFVILIINLYNE